MGDSQGEDEQTGTTLNSKKPEDEHSPESDDLDQLIYHNRQIIEKVQAIQQI